MLGALGAVVAVFLPLVQAPGILPIDDNTLVQNSPGSAIMVGLLALIALYAAYEYHQTGWTGIRAIVAGAFLLVGAVLTGSNDEMYELTTYGSEFLPDTIEGSPGIATYVLGAAGLVVMSGGFIMRSNRDEPTSSTATARAADAHETGWDIDPRDPALERWREGDRWTGATRPRSQPTGD